ncbi:MAG: SDR family oxidoreductase [Candidatus Omnitrophota bacterium]|nr:SDR family oxidoreductase [Candidatus Omnitrophota bacterium]MDZ4242238.1 SDR family oxidoreductase [Candidatus Omnitrophota bacterium]
MKKTALITGASSGIGMEFARVFASEQYDLVLVARREERLKELAQDLHEKHGVSVKNIISDLTEVGAARSIYQEVRDNDIVVDVLVNNAGFGGFGEFARSDLQKMTEMVQVNVAVLMQLTRLFLDDMIARKEGRILNVASMAAFVPGPLMSVYYASKAFVLSFSEAVASELKGTGVFITVLCPGPVQSEFQLVAYRENPSVTRKRRIPTAAETARFGYEAMKEKKLIAITGFTNKAIPFFVRLLPRQFLAEIARRRQELHRKTTHTAG